MTSPSRSMRRRVRAALAAVLAIAGAFCCGGPAAAADAGDWSSLTTTVFRDVGNVGGVSGTSVTALAQDGDGFLWVGGQSGLARWDGYRFRPYVPDPQAAGSLPDSYVNALHADRRGRLWIGTDSGGLSRYDPERDRFVTYAARRNGLSANSVIALADDDKNGLWVATTAGLDHFVDEAGRFEHLRHDGHAGGLPDVIHALLRDRRGSLWVAADGGLVRRDPGSNRFVSVTLSADDGQRPAAWNLFEDSSRRIWVGTAHHGVYVIGPDRRARALHVVGAGRAESVLETETIKAIQEVRSGELWFGTQSHGIIALTVASKRLRWMQNDPAVATSLPQNSVWSIYRDRAGLIWVGTLNGLRRSDPGQAAVSTITVASNKSAGMTSVDATAIFVANNHRVWFGQGSDGIDLVDPARGRVGALRPNSTTPRTALPNAGSDVIAGFPQGPVYVGTDHGLYRADSDGRHLQQTALTREPGNNAIALCAAYDALWIGTSSNGVWRLDPRATGVAARPRRLRSARLTDKRISVIAPASRDHLWVGTYNGLNLVDTRTGAVEQIRPQPRDPTRLVAGFIASLLTDRRGRLWVGTFGGGIEILERRDGSGRPRFRQLSIRQGLPNINVDSLLLDRQGRVWAATDNGIAVIDSGTLSVRTLTRADGVELSSYWLGSRATLGNGDLLFGASGGVTIVRPALVRDWAYEPPVVITDVRIGGRPVPARRLDQRGASAPFVITPTANSIGIEFAALDFSAPDQNRYAYRLDGFDAEWTETDPSRRLAAYTNLPPGTYTLELRGSNRSGKWNASTLAVPIRVVPAWHQTIAFKGVEALAALLALAALVQIRTRYLRAREHELEHQVSQRTAELQALAAELRASKQQLELIAYRDPLTDLPNRRMFAGTFRTMLAAAGRRNSQIALLLIDLDRFKAVNDTLGHDAGDALLIEAAIRLRSVVRAADCVARVGGDEFAILLADGYDPADVDIICTRVVECFTAPVVFNDSAITTSPSIGVAVFPQHGANPDVLYKSADIALYEAKQAGRNTWRWFQLARV